MIPPGVALALFSLAVGWLALAPARRSLGWGYHLAALPVGMLLWGPLSDTTTLLGVGYTAPVVLGCAAAYVMVLAAATWALARRAEPRAAGLWGFPAVGAAYAAVAWIAARLGLSIFTADSWSNYEVMGVQLFDTGKVSVHIISNRGLLLPALHGANRFFGGDWMYVLYPVMAASVAAVLTWVLASTAFRSWTLGARLGGALGVTFLLVSTAPFLLHSVYVHSHMISALYLLLALAAFAQAHGSEEDGSRPLWLFIAGLAAAGFVLTRPDGPAYIIVLHVVAAVLLLRDRVSMRELAAYFAPVLAVMAYHYGMLFALYGLFEPPERLSGRATLAIVAVSFAAPVVTWAIGRTRIVKQALSRENVLLGVALAIDALAVAGAWLFKPDDMSKAVSNAALNLFERGGWNLVWFFVVGVVIIALLAVEARRRSAFSTILLLAIVQFSVVAMLVHGLSHPGRLGWGDSLNRVAFHIVPVAFWLFGSVWAGTKAVLAGPSEGAASASQQASRVVDGGHERVS